MFKLIRIRCSIFNNGSDTKVSNENESFHRKLSYSVTAWSIPVYSKTVNQSRLATRVDGSKDENEASYGVI